MTSETRANWIFLGIFLLLMGPGLIMLTAKSYKRGAAGMNPPAPKTVAAYNNTTPQNPAMPRVVPPQTADLVESIAFRLQKLQPELRRIKAPDGKPLMSEERFLECVAIGSKDQHQYVALIGWDRNFAPLPTLYRFTGRQNGDSVDLKMTAYEQKNMPLEVRDELQKYGYIRPPDSFMWIVLQAPAAAPLDTIELRYEMENIVIKDRLSFPQASSPTTGPVDGSSHP